MYQSQIFWIAIVLIQKVVKKYLGSKSLKQSPFVVYADFETVLEKINGCENNPKKSFTMGVPKHTPCGFSMSVKYAYGDD